VFFKCLRAYVHAFVRSCACVVRIVHTHELPQTHARTHIHNSVCKQYWAFSLFSCPWPPPYTGSKLAQSERGEGGGGREGGGGERERGIDRETEIERER
jgi:hypothetical protein